MNRVLFYLGCSLCLVIVEFGVIIHLLIAKTHDSEHVCMPQGPTSGFPCKNTKDISAWIGDLTAYNINKYDLYINKNFTPDTLVKVKFDAEVNVTFPEQKNGSISVSLNAGDTVEIRLIVTHTGLSFNVIGLTPTFPNLSSLSIDNEEYCNEPDMRFLTQFIEDKNSTKDKLQWYDVSKKTDKPHYQCGRRRKIDTGSVTNGVANTKDWPWHVAVYLGMGDSPLKYACGGTLISPTYVVTAAQCTEFLRASKFADRFTVVLGKYNLQSSDDDTTIEIEVDKIITPEDYTSLELSNDIALLKLKSEVEYTEYIQPACLWHKREKLINVTDDSILGTLVGWGFTNDNDLSQPLQQVNLPIVSRKTCIESNPSSFTKLLQKNDFCAGYHNNGTSACNGDSGGALQVFISDGNEKVSGAWYVRGILSKGVRNPDSNVCDENQYSVFTDVDKFSNWIDRYVND